MKRLLIELLDLAHYVVLFIAFDLGQHHLYGTTAGCLLAASILRNEYDIRKADLAQRR